MVVSSTSLQNLPSVFNQLRSDPFLLGFDQLFDRLVSSSAGTAQASSYPPYNIVKVADDEFRIELAIAGFNKEEIEVTVHEDKLTVESTKDHSAFGGGEVLIHQGIAERNFKRTWTLSPTIRVTDATFSNGFLSVYLLNEVPEKDKPRTIDIRTHNIENGYTRDSQQLNE